MLTQNYFWKIKILLQNHALIWLQNLMLVSFLYTHFQRKRCWFFETINSSAYIVHLLNKSRKSRKSRDLALESLESLGLLKSRDFENPSRELET